MGFSTVWRVKMSAESGRVKKSPCHSWALGDADGWGRTLQNLEVLKVGIFGVDIELDPGHGHVHCKKKKSSYQYSCPCRLEVS